MLPVVLVLQFLSTTESRTPKWNPEPMNELGIYASTMSVTRGGPSFSNMQMRINTDFVTPEYFVNLYERCLNNVSGTVTKDHMGYDIRTDDCVVTRDWLIMNMTLSPKEKEDPLKKMVDYNVTHKEVEVKSFVDKETGKTCYLGMGIYRKFYASVKQNRFVRPSWSKSESKDIYALDIFGEQAFTFFEEVVNPKYIYQGTEVFFIPELYRCLLSIMTPNTPVSEIRDSCEFDCAGDEHFFSDEELQHDEL